MKLLKKSLLFLMVGSLVSCGASSAESKEINKCYEIINNDILSHRCKVDYYFQDPDTLEYYLRYEVSFDETKMMISSPSFDSINYVYAELIDKTMYYYQRQHRITSGVLTPWNKVTYDSEYYMLNFWRLIEEEEYYCINSIFNYISNHIEEDPKVFEEGVFQPFMEILNSNKKTAKIEDGNLVIPYITLVDIENLNWYWHLENLNVTFKNEHIDTFSFNSYQNREHKLIHSIKLSNVGTNAVERPDDLVIE